MAPPDRQLEPEGRPFSRGTVDGTGVSASPPSTRRLRQLWGAREEGRGILSGTYLTSATARCSFSERSRDPRRATLRAWATYPGGGGWSQEQQAPLSMRSLGSVFKACTLPPPNPVSSCQALSVMGVARMTSAATELCRHPPESMTA